MPISATALTLMLVLAFAAFPAKAADALFQSGLESSICDTSYAEIEPNDTVATAQDVAFDSAASAKICGAINPGSGDVDWFRITIAGTSTVLIETIRADGAPCDPRLLMSLALFDSAGNTTIATDNNGGVGGCASLDGVTSPALQNLTPGHYYIKVYSLSATSIEADPVYALSIRLL